MINERIRKMDIGLFISSLLLLACGIVLVYSSSFALASVKYGDGYFFLARQAVRALVAIAGFMIFINVDYHFWTKHSTIAFVVAVALLIMVLVMPQGQAIKGARRWITIGFIRFQVSEFARTVLILMLAHQLGTMGEAIREWKQFAILLAKVLIICSLIILEPDFSTAMAVGLIALAILFIAGARISHLAGIAALSIPVIALVSTSSSYRLQRWAGFMDKAAHRKDIGYQAFQALVGLGNGGLFGQGLGQGNQKYFYLPEPHTDFAFAILGEEVGFIGLAVVLAIFLFMIFRGFRIAFRAPDLPGQLVAFGFTLTMAVYVVLHVSVNTGLVPTTGVPLPFLSYGGMNLIFMMCCMGILLNISSQCSPTAAKKAKFSENFDREPSMGKQQKRRWKSSRAAYRRKGLR
ncbi:MAG: putative lipid II flippase FtsW [Chitinivibrionales bacterium]|nr:putative lipid II flippase FtsW [Chitinivibrionales bacterium]